MVELFAAGRLTRTPELVTPAAHVAACGLPTEAKLNEPKGPDPLNGIHFCSSVLQNYTRFSHHGHVHAELHPAASGARCFSVARIQTAYCLWDRTHGLLLPEQTGSLP